MEEIFNIEDIAHLTKWENNNILLELERKLINNTGNNKISNTETSLDLFKNLIKTLEKEGLINKELGYGIHDMLSKINFDEAIRRYMVSMKIFLATLDEGSLEKLENLKRKVLLILLVLESPLDWIVNLEANQTSLKTQF